MKSLKTVLNIFLIVALAACLCLCSFTCGKGYGRVVDYQGRGGYIESLIIEFEKLPAYTYDVYFGDENGVKLDGYTKICSLEAVEKETATVEIKDLVVPAAAKTLCLDDGFGNQIFLENIIKIPDQCLISGELDYAFGALSDIHYNKYDGYGQGDDAKIALKKALDLFESKGVSLVGVAGDVSNDSETDSFTSFINDIKDYDFDVFTVSGNHDYKAIEDGTWQSIITEAYKNAEGVCDFSPDGYDFTYISPADENKSDVFIFLNQTYWDYGSYDSQLLTKSQLQWFSEMVEKYNDKTIYLFFHSFLAGPKGGANTSVGNIRNPGGYAYKPVFSYGSIEERAFRAILKENKNIVFFSGHSHWVFEMDVYNEDTNFSNFDGEYCYMVHVPSVTAPRTIGENDTQRTSLAGKESQGWIVSVYDECIVLEAYDIMMGIVLTDYNQIIYLG